MAITSEIIGKLGGADVESAEVAGQEITASNMAIHTVEVPAGEQVLAVFIGRFSKLPSLIQNHASIELGGSSVRAVGTGIDAAVAAVLTQTASLTMSGSSGVNSSTFTGGTVYTVKM